jgi:hypothetical protein
MREVNRARISAANTPSVAVGERYGRLTVRAYAGQPRRERRWLCECDCGEMVEVGTGSLRSGNTRSCGCLRRDTNTARLTTHGASKTRTYASWKTMLQRCDDENHVAFSYYGGRGITVCERWRSFENFLADMGKRPEGKTLDRIDPDGNYEPSNCRWATYKEQRANHRPKKVG